MSAGQEIPTTSSCNLAGSRILSATTTVVRSTVRLWASTTFQALTSSGVIVMTMSCCPPR
eukprot:1074265-Amphidinium_carterae.1